MFDSMRIRSKLAIALSVPLVALVIFSSLVVRSSARDADDAGRRAEQIREQVALARASFGPGGMVTALQAERAGEAVALLGLEGVNLGAPGETNNDRRTTSDRAMTSFRVTIAGEPESVQNIYRETLTALEDVKALRNEIDNYTGVRSLTQTYGYVKTIFDRYSKVIQTAFDANSRVSLEVQDARLRGGAELIDLAMRTKEVETLMVRELLLGELTQGLQPEELDRVLVLQTRSRGYDEDLRIRAVGEYAKLVGPLLDAPDLVSFRGAADDAIAGKGVNMMTLLTFSSKGLVPFNDFATAAADRLRADAQALQGAAETEADTAGSARLLVLLMAAITVIVAATITVLAARSIRIPMQRLAADAEDMAGRRLPAMVRAILDTPAGETVVMPEIDPVPAGGAREVGEVARSLETVQRSAAELATEQALLRRNIADSFVNLGRRNQNLLDRQLDAITEMERAETDPADLQKLFALDHLATRMRRNAESLLLLAGLEPHRQWSAPVALIDVLRGALGEVEDYQRARIVRLDEARVDGSTVADLTHLVAELLENALHFSPPGRDVEISGRSVDGRFVLVIVDYGVGMSRDELARANRRLAGGESFTVAPSRYLGHYVVGTQAARLGVTVSLHDTPAGGVTARVDLTNLVVSEAANDPDAAADGPTRDDAATDAEAEAEDEATSRRFAHDAGAVHRNGAVAAATTNGRGSGASTSVARPPASPRPPAPRAQAPNGPKPPSGPSASAGPKPPTAAAGPNAPRPQSPQRPLDAAPPAGPRAPGTADSHGGARPPGRRPGPPPGSTPSADSTAPPPSAPTSPTAPSAADRPLPAEGGTTPSGYTRRVRGAHTPRTDVIAARGPDAGLFGAPEAPASTADGVRTLLSGLQQGTARGQAAAAAAPAGTTPSGYAKRVRGAHAPRTDVVAAHRGDPDEIDLRDAPTSTADGMRNLLSGLQEGTRRGQAEAAGDDETTQHEEHGA